MTATRYRTARKLILIHGALSAGVLALVATGGDDVTGFMWGRSIALIIVAALLFRLAGGTERARARLATVAVIMPIAIVGVDLIPGLCPWWYTAAQTVSVLPIVAMAIVLKRR
ncbi:hypothetical protein Afil01_02160 [Actinorhabdospora filicis]|uniref:Uncharacterized protein n=1 Tax=Actinorhabdospora filicis TaxID=1785913 RepID=A0A9W6W6C0_9ACTN|nr:hypothetical protein [Actinorhabdospora filicis]GLZ75409.1 hypothetical protein Afil01_02160 [Actinorhabdospora filicis]